MTLCSALLFQAADCYLCVFALTMTRQWDLLKRLEDITETRPLCCKAVTVVSATTLPPFLANSLDIFLKAG